MKKPLSKTNPYLRKAISRAASTATTVVSSSSIEGIHVTRVNEKTANWSIAVSHPHKKKKE
jgi:hypothetical protein